jgi:HEAT repeat protein
MLRRAITIAIIAGCATFTTSAPAATNENYVQMVVGLLTNPDVEFRAAALDQVRRGPKSPELTAACAAQLSKLDAGGQISLISALGDRGDAAARPAASELLKMSNDENVRAAVLGMFAKLGAADDVRLLVESMSAGSAAERNAARQGLVQLRGDNANAAIASVERSATGAQKAALIDVLAARRAIGETPAFIASIGDADPQVRTAAMNALGQLGRPEELPAMIDGVLKAQKGGERDAAEKNVALVCSRIDNEDQRADVLISAMNSVSAAERDDLLSLVGRVGGKKLINFVGDIASADDPARRVIGLDALGKWPDANAADKLLEIANKTTDVNERRLAFGGFVKISATRDKRNDGERLKRMKQAMAAAKSPEEQSLVINRCRTAYDVNSLRFVLPFADDPQFAQIACETIVELAHHREVRDPNKAEFDTALDKVIATSKDPVVVDRAGRYKRGETWNRPTK